MKRAQMEGADASPGGLPRLGASQMGRHRISYGFFMYVQIHIIHIHIGLTHRPSTKPSTFSSAMPGFPFGLGSSSQGLPRNRHRWGSTHRETSSRLCLHNISNVCLYRYLCLYSYFLRSFFYARFIGQPNSDPISSNPGHGCETTRFILEGLLQLSTRCFCQSINLFLRYMGQIPVPSKEP